MIFFHISSNAQPCLGISVLFCMVDCMFSVNRTAIKVQLFDIASLSMAEEVRKLNSTGVDIQTASSNCSVPGYLRNGERSTDHLIRNVSFGPGSFTGTLLKAIERSGKVFLQLNMTFPLTPDQVRSGEIDLMSDSVASLHLRAFAVSNFTPDYCKSVKCSNDPFCTKKLQPEAVVRSIDRWHSAVGSNEGQPALGCHLKLSMGPTYVHEGTGFSDGIQFYIMKELVSMQTAIELLHWSSNFPEIFFQGVSNINVTVAGASLSIAYRKGEIQTSTNWFFTTNGIVNLTLMGILGFNILAIFFALMFCACSRSKRAFDMEIWDYAMSRKENSDQDPW